MSGEFGFFLWESSGGLMERQDTHIEARNPSYVNTADVAASQPRYNLRSTGEANKGELSITEVDPQHCAIHSM